jgi:hypothetical protein
MAIQGFVKKVWNKSVVCIELRVLIIRKFLFKDIHGLVVLVCTFFVFFSPLKVLAQVDSLYVHEAFRQIEDSKRIKFFYRYEWIQGKKLPLSAINSDLSIFMEAVLSTSNITYLIYRDKYVILLPREGMDAPKGTSAIRENLSLEKFLLRGSVKDANSGEAIPGVSIYISDLGIGTTSNSVGYYELLIPRGVYTLTVSAVGKASLSSNLVSENNKELNFDLFDQTISLSEVVVKGEAIDRNVNSVDMGLVKLNSRLMKLMPKFFGETDILKSVSMLPGVSSVGEGSSGFNVRGGNVDQNLVLLDDVPVLNTSHLFGFMSAFNPDVVKDVTLYKAGIPANFGGRISSVMDVKVKDSESKKIVGAGSLGIITSKVMLEGPLFRDKTSFVIGARYGYPNWLLKKVPDKNIRNSSASFYDFNLVMKHHINTKNSICASVYNSVDHFKLAGDTLYGYSTFNSSLRLNSLISKRLILTVSGNYSDYSYSLEANSNGLGFLATFGVRSYTGKVDLTIFSSAKNKMDLGIMAIAHRFSPGNLKPGNGSSVNSLNVQQERAIESAFYLSDEFKLNNGIALQAGVRFSQYTNVGPGSTFIYQENIPKSLSSIIDTVVYKRDDRIRTYNGLEPRVSVKISLHQNGSIKLSYNRNMQYMHLISNATAVSPLDTWKSSNWNIKPQSGNHFALGYFRNFNTNVIETSLEVYYKKVEGMLEYKDGANLFLNQAIETELLPATAKMYGLELFVRKNSGKATGWISYTYSRSFRKVDGPTIQEKINNGNYYPSNFDRPHNLSTVLNFRFNRRLSLSSNFTYSSGRPITYPVNIYIVDGYVVTHYSDRNSERLLSYHRMDISFNIEQNLKLNKRWKGSWSLSIYNVYGRKNQYSVFFKPTYNGKLPQAYQLSVLGSVLPSITYNFTF